MNAISLAFANKAFENPYVGSEYQVDTKLEVHALAVIMNVSAVLLGVILVLFGMLVAITTTTDILFLTLPSVHEHISEVLDRFRREGKTEKKIVILSRQAIDAWEEANNTGKNPLILYLKKRMIFYAGAATIVFFMVSGWTQIVGLVAKVIYYLLHGLKLV